MKHVVVAVEAGPHPAPILSLLWALVLDGFVVDALHVALPTTEADVGWRTRATGPRGGLSQLRSKLAGAIPLRAGVHVHRGERCREEAVAAARNGGASVLLMGLDELADGERVVSLAFEPPGAIGDENFYFPGQEEQRLEIDGQRVYASQVRPVLSS
jgi:hypothetical protein